MQLINSPCRFIFTIFLLTAFFNNTSLAQSNPTDSIRISGKVDLSISQSISISYFVDQISLDKSIHTIPLDDSLSFSKTFFFGKPTILYINYLNYSTPIFVEPGNKIDLHFEGSNLKETICFDGNGSEQNTFLTQYLNHFSRYNNDFILYEIAEMGPMEFRRFMDRIHKNKWDFYNNYDATTKEKFSHTFHDYISSEIDYWWAYNLLRYPFEHPAVDEESNDSIQPPASFFSFLDKLLINNDNALNNQHYLYFLNQYYNLSKAKGYTDILQPELRYVVSTSGTIILSAPVSGTYLAQEDRHARLKSLGEKSDKKSRVQINGHTVETTWTKVRTSHGVVGWVPNNSIMKEYDLSGIGRYKIDPNYARMQKYMSGKALHYLVGNDLYWRTHVEAPDSIKLEIEEFIRVNPIVELDAIITDVYEDAKSGWASYDAEISVKENVSPAPEEATMTAAKDALWLPGLPAGIHEVLPAFLVSQEIPIPEPEVVISNTTVTKESSMFPRFPKAKPKPLTKYRDKYVDVGEVVPVATKSTQLSGMVNHSSSLVLKLIYTKNPILFELETMEFEIDKTGRFSQSIELAQPVIGTLKYGSQEVDLYLKPGDNLFVSFDGNSFFKTVSFRGSSGEINNYLAAAKRKFRDGNRLTKSKMESSTVDLFSKFMDQQRLSRLKFLGEHKAKGLPNEFMKYAQGEIEAWYAYNLFNFPLERALASGKNDPIPVDPSYYKFLKNVEVDNAEALPGKNYIYFLDQYFEYQMTLPKNRGISKNRLAKKHLSGETLSFYVAKELAKEVKRGRVKEKGKDIKKYIASSSNENYNNALRTVYNDEKGLIKGSDAPDFTLKDLNGIDVNLADFKGKIIYLDFWASWCTPCIYKMKNSQIWKSQLESKGVVFLYISLDEDKTKWRNFLKSQNFLGIHLVSDEKGSYKSSIAKKYKVKKLPSVFLIDQNGKIVYNSHKDNNISAKDQINYLLYSN